MTEKQELQLREKKELKQEGEPTREGTVFYPEVDIFETESAMVMVADVPGATTDGLDLDLKENLLELTAKVNELDRRWKPVYLEYEVGAFMRQFRIGQIVDKTKIAAEMRDGVLKVTLPKVEKALPRKIDIKIDR